IWPCSSIWTPRCCCDRRRGRSGGTFDRSRRYQERGNGFFMAIRVIVKHPDPVLREKAKPVPKITPSIQKLLTDMAETMYDAPGVGLAAPQVGILKRVIVIDVVDEHGLIEMVNPEIIESSGEQFGPEGFL